MTERPQEKALEKIIPKLKENTTDSEQFMITRASQRVTEKIDTVIKNLQSLVNRSSISLIFNGGGLPLILNELENMRETLTYYTDYVDSTTKSYKTYIHALETLYNEYKTCETESAKITTSVSEPTRIKTSVSEPTRIKTSVSEPTRIKTSVSEPTRIVKKTQSNNNLLSDEMYNKIYSALKEKGVREISPPTAYKIGISKATFFRFLRIGLLRGDITKVGHAQYEFVAAPTTGIETTSEEEISKPAMISKEIDEDEEEANQEEISKPAMISKEIDEDEEEANQEEISKPVVIKAAIGKEEIDEEM